MKSIIGEVNTGSKSVRFEPGFSNCKDTGFEGTVSAEKKLSSFSNFYNCCSKI